MAEGKNHWPWMGKLKIPALIFLVGLFLLLLPSGGGDKSTERKEDLLLQELLTQTQGVGEARVLISDSGVVVVCRGASDPAVRLDIIRAVGAYTGFGADKITVLKLADSG